MVFFIHQRHFANILSIFNLLCGIVAIACIFHEYYILGVLFFMGGQLCDLFDGKVARKYGSTKHGAVFDDVADAVSFGILPGVSIIALYGESLATYAIMGVFIGSVFYRLWRFVARDQKNTSIKKGNFSGLPSPAGALMVLSFLLTEPEILLAGLVVCLISGLMISRIPFAHAGKVLMKRIRKKHATFLVMLGVFVLILSEKTQNYDILFYFLFGLGVSYMLSGWLLRVK